MTTRSANGANSSVIPSRNEAVGHPFPLRFTPAAEGTEAETPASLHAGHVIPFRLEYEAAYATNPASRASMSTGSVIESRAA